MNIFNIQRSFELKKERGWQKIYVVVDAHGTLIKPYHNTIEFYPYANEVMRWFNNRLDFSTILWTSSYSVEIDTILKACNNAGFFFTYVNSNPAEKNSERACLDKKFYFNVLLDDKSGFEPDTDWQLIKLELIRIGEW